MLRALNFVDCSLGAANISELSSAHFVWFNTGWSSPRLTIPANRFISASLGRGIDFGAPSKLVQIRH